MLGITLQAELTYSNVLEVLDLAGIPIRAAERGPSDPIVIAGGPSASNPAPMAPFFDAFFMGESEEAFEAVLDAIDSAPDRAGRMRLLEQIPSIYVPSWAAGPSSAPSTPSSASRRSRPRRSCPTRRPSSRARPSR
jgi:Fe-S oxidoreductase